MQTNEFYSQLTEQDLDSLQAELSNAISVHLHWVGEVNKAIIFNSGDFQGYCDSDSPYKHCKFGQWYDHVANKKIIDNEDFKLIGLFHQDVHMIVCSLMDEISETQTIPDQYYSAFLESQNNFFEKLIDFSISVSGISRK